MKFKPYSSLKDVEYLKKDTISMLDLTWISNWISKPIAPLSCNWAGYMQRVYSNETNFQKSSVIMLPLIDLSLSDPTYILSTLLFVRKQATKQGIKTPCLTFDQPLWFKATAIIEEMNLNIQCRLGGFHLLMSFLGSVGRLMDGSGLDEVLEQVYAANVVPHMLSGKAYARALRGHMLVHAALYKIIFDALLQSDLLSTNNLNILASFSPEEDDIDTVLVKL